MILVDFSGCMHAAIAVDLNANPGTKTDIAYLRKIIFEQIRSYHRKFSSKYGELIICLDSNTGNWRKEIFPLYKYSRQKARAESLIDWKAVFADVETIITEMREVFPFKVIRVPGLEADDVIAILAMNAEQFTPKNLFDEMAYPVLIVSNDKDFKQLHRFKHIKQYIPRSANIIKEEDPEFYLINQILHGDASDGVPNVKSPENIFTLYGQRQSPVRSTFVKQFITEGEACLTDFEKERYKMNKLLIDLTQIPVKYYDLVFEEMKTIVPINKFALMQYFASKKLNSLIDKIDDFYR